MLASGPTPATSSGNGARNDVAQVYGTAVACYAHTSILPSVIFNAASVKAMQILKLVSPSL
eukprot:4589253-Amphidinium_carterae.1